MALLRRRGDTLFAEWLEGDRAKIAAGKTGALVHLLGAFGGMGSLNDVVFDDLHEGERFRKLTGAIWANAKAMLEELDEGRHYR